MRHSHDEVSDLVADGDGDKLIAAQLDLCPKAVAIIRRELGLKKLRKPWTADKVVNLTRLWRNGYSASAIGKTIGMSRNAVIGKAGRLGLEPRESPIKRAPVLSREQIERVQQADRDGISARSIAVMVGVSLRAVYDHRQPPKHKMLIASVRSGAPPSKPPMTCQYIAGDPSAEDACKCGKPVKEGSSYCPEHHGLCHLERAA